MVVRTHRTVQNKNQIIRCVPYTWVQIKGFGKDPFLAFHIYKRGNYHLHMQLPIQFPIIIKFFDTLSNISFVLNYLLFIHAPKRASLKCLSRFSHYRKKWLITTYYFLLLKLNSFSSLSTITLQCFKRQKPVSIKSVPLPSFFFGILKNYKIYVLYDLKALVLQYRKHCLIIKHPWKCINTD